MWAGVGGGEVGRNGPSMKAAEGGRELGSELLWQHTAMGTKFLGLGPWGSAVSEGGAMIDSQQRIFQGLFRKGTPQSCGHCNSVVRDERGRKPRWRHRARSWPDVGVVLGLLRDVGLVGVMNVCTHVHMRAYAHA